MQLGYGKEKRKKKELKEDKCILDIPVKCLEAPRGSEIQPRWISRRYICV